ncbi:MAG: GYF domain-containing protein, partial [archaeon]|nr:GYF domain-containing protein [archaeon]
MTDINSSSGAPSKPDSKPDSKPMNLEPEWLTAGTKNRKKKVSPDDKPETAAAPARTEYRRDHHEGVHRLGDRPGEGRMQPERVGGEISDRRPSDRMGSDRFSDRSFPSDRSSGDRYSASRNVRHSDRPAGSFDRHSGGGASLDRNDGRMSNRPYRPPMHLHQMTGRPSEQYSDQPGGFSEEPLHHQRNNRGKPGDHHRDHDGLGRTGHRDHQQHDGRNEGEGDGERGSWRQAPAPRPFQYSKRDLLSFYHPSQLLPTDFVLAQGLFSEESLGPVSVGGQDLATISRVNAPFSSAARTRTRGTGRVARGGAASARSGPGDSRLGGGDPKWSKESGDNVWRTVEAGDEGDDDFSAYGRAYDDDNGPMPPSQKFSGPDSHNDQDAFDDDFPDQEDDLDVTGWFYIDPKNRLQGPFPSSDMTAWYRDKHFPPTLKVKQGKHGQFAILSELGPRPFDPKPALDLHPADKKPAANLEKMLGSWIDEDTPSDQAPARPSLLERLNLAPPDSAAAPSPAQQPAQQLATTAPPKSQPAAAAA